jgi:uncharacterized membrane protein YsdA (DUF1294 family)
VFSEAQAAGASGLAFGLYWMDKRSALADRRRVPENRLHLAGLLGGWPGALLAQQMFRHKTRKASFQIVRTRYCHGRSSGNPFA